MPRKEVDLVVQGVDLSPIRNRMEGRVAELLPEVLERYPEFRPSPIDIEDIYALALNLIPARYTQRYSFVINEPVNDEFVRYMIDIAVHRVWRKPKGGKR